MLCQSENSCRLLLPERLPPFEPDSIIILTKSAKLKALNLGQMENHLLVLGDAARTPPGEMAMQI